MRERAQRDRESDGENARLREGLSSEQLERTAQEYEEGADRWARMHELTRAAGWRAEAATLRRILRDRSQRMIAGGLLALAGTGMVLGGVNTAPGTTAQPAATSAPTSAAATPSPAPVPGNSVPFAGAIVAVLQPPNTTYVVEAGDNDGDTLTYRWSSTNTCDSFTFNGRTAVWRHQHPPCNENEPFHPGTITVVISDGKGGEITRTYTNGSASGTGPVPPNPTAAAIPTATSRPTTASPAPTTAAPTAAPAAGTGPNVPLVAGGLLLLGGGLGLFGSGWRMPGGPIMATPRPTEPADPCAKEKAAEAAARARRDAARRRRQRIRDLRAANDAAQRELDRAAREDAASKDDRNVSWGEDAEVGRASRIYTNADQRARIARAEAALAAARAAADAARQAYEGAGDGGEETAAQQELDGAEAEWQQADAALQRCLRANAPTVAPSPAPAPPPPTPPPSTPSGPPVSVATTPTQSSRPRRTTTETTYRCSLHVDLDPTAFRGGMGHGNADLSRTTITKDEQGQVVSTETAEDVYDFAPRASQTGMWEVLVSGTPGQVDRDPGPTQHSRGTHWYYVITQEQYEAAKAWGDAQVESPPSYRATTYNCIDFALDLVRHAGVTPPAAWGWDESNMYVGLLINVRTPSLLVQGINEVHAACEHGDWKKHPFRVDPESAQPDWWIWECGRCGAIKKGTEQAPF